MPPSTHGVSSSSLWLCRASERRDGRVERGRVPQSGVAVAGGERARHRAAGPRARGLFVVRELGRRRRVGRVLVGNQAARVVAARAREVGVDVHAAGHHDHAARVERRRAGGQALHDPAVLDADVADLAVDAVGRIVDGAARDPEPFRAAHAVLPVRRARTAREQRGQRVRGRARRHRAADAAAAAPRPCGTPCRPRECRRRRYRSRPGRGTALRSPAGRSRSPAIARRLAASASANAPAEPATRIAPAPPAPSSASPRLAGRYRG